MKFLLFAFLFCYFYSAFFRFLVIAGGGGGALVAHQQQQGGGGGVVNQQQHGGVGDHIAAAQQQEEHIFADVANLLIDVADQMGALNVIHEAMAAAQANLAAAANQGNRYNELCHFISIICLQIIVLLDVFYLMKVLERLMKWMKGMGRLKKVTTG